MDEEAMRSDSVECLVQRRKPLLTVQDEVRRCVAVEWRCLGHFARDEETAVRILDAEGTACRKILADAFDQFFGRPWIPHEITLKVGECDLSIVDAFEQIAELLGCGIENLAHVPSTQPDGGWFPHLMTDAEQG